MVYDELTVKQFVMTEYLLEFLSGGDENYDILYKINKKFSPSYSYEDFYWTLLVKTVKERFIGQFIGLISVNCP